VTLASTGGAVAQALPDPIERLVSATNDHDVAAVVACFRDDYVNETPAHPMRGFKGREQVRRNWEQIFAGVPDLRADLLAFAVHEHSVWTEWELRGTRRDGTQHRMAGVIVFGLDGDAIASARFFLEPVEVASGTVDDAVRAEVVRR
jgi:ketosteroid isomerase-like protein